ncbi:MAG: carboxylating.nicotinate-nucleotide diphosphorylase [Thermoplasmata archaeon]|nr:carboxylating nicotinate-nucleotide diphosphorylase [Euryarchaeota archaeon]RLF65012.1 MAG: carboxylating.nicotinate-nucleotide diphosphorylase [Thermoplasmata archaeon]
MNKKLYVNYLLKFIEEDAPYGDVTSAVIIPDNCDVKAEIISKSEGILAGVLEAKTLFEHFGIRYKIIKDDGEKIKLGDIIMTLEGAAKDILLLERTVLNIMGRMSGIATMTRELVERVRKINPKVKVAGTRKSLLRLLDKRAIAIGGGDPHRYSLSDAVLIKDNHLKIVSLKEAIKKAKEYTNYKVIEVEVESLEDAIKAVMAGADVIMLDNMAPEDVEKVIKELKRRGLRDRVKIEVSGGITMENIDEYAKLDIDVISLGALTHSVRNIDFSLEVIEVLRSL